MLKRFESDTLDRPLELLTRPGDLADHYDLTVAHASDPDPAGRLGDFDAWLAEASDSYGLRAARLSPAVAADAAALVESGDVSIGLHVSCESDWSEDDPLSRLAFAVQDAGGHPLNAPARARAFSDCSNLHHELD